ncbi:hypothetical protein N5923_14940 [Erwiniaceae bacterium BAC15a-03b]|uniref:N-acetyltransferase domain-containing protein n=1 Tax=Winslowiella arboricola TaxID=2978220 RepID=A0A9J6PN20_9GAMM|nr:hypothetical protein [Winslowiella arboricola]MCU5773203.1 hypothetical protein [Winslowiella arboricola]MCU5778786.1 hypothetical protein [Winslowiella arboricola]
MICRHAKRSDLDKVCDLLAAEFYNDPVHKVVFATLEDRVDVLRRFFRIYVNLANDCGGTLLAENDAGALVYFRPEAIEMISKNHAAVNNQLIEVCGSSFATALAYINGLDHFHPRTPPHYYISLLAVNRQSRGGAVVRDLFRDLHSILDKDHFPCYAECTRFSTRTLLRRWGYRDAGAPLCIEGFPELYPIWREPQ